MATLLAARVLVDTGAHAAPILTGSLNVIIGGFPAARKGDPITCPVHGEAKIAEGSSSVFINGHPAARMGDKTGCGTPPPPPAVSPPKVVSTVDPYIEFIKNASFIDENAKKEYIDRYIKASASANINILNAHIEALRTENELALKAGVSVLDAKAQANIELMGILEAKVEANVKILSANFEQHVYTGDGAYGLVQKANAVVAHGDAKATFGLNDGLIYVEAKASGDVLYAEHEATFVVYEGKDGKYGMKFRSTEQAGLLRGGVSLGLESDLINAEAEYQKDKKSEKHEKNIKPNIGVDGILGGVGWDVGFEYIIDTNDYSLEAGFGIAAALGIGGKLKGNFKISIAPIIDLAQHIDIPLPIPVPGFVLSGCPSVIIGG